MAVEENVARRHGARSRARVALTERSVMDTREKYEKNVANNTWQDRRSTYLRSSSRAVRCVGISLISKYAHARSSLTGRIARRFGGRDRTRPREMTDRALTGVYGRLRAAFAQTTPKQMMEDRVVADRSIGSSNQTRGNTFARYGIAYDGTGRTDSCSNLFFSNLFFNRYRYVGNGARAPSSSLFVRLSRGRRALDGTTKRRTTRQRDDGNVDDPARASRGNDHAIGQ